MNWLVLKAKHYGIQTYRRWVISKNKSLLVTTAQPKLLEDGH
ncbi:hypothetical protein PMIT1306_01650 [Prochlorococcus sp. MIT 1306]|nr:hypothetical protein PMIT1306_01650 [Prochlorococcus sp. MIT 1306]